MDAHRDARLIDGRHGVRGRGASWRVLVEVLDQALDRDVGDAPNDVEVVAVNVSVEDAEHLA